MKKLIIKLDRYILDSLTSFILIWIKKRNYEKHKIDFKIQTQWIQLFMLLLFCITMPVIFYALIGEIISAMLQVVIWGMAALIDYFFIQIAITKTKPDHDRLFSLRKNPAVYENEKRMSEWLFVETRKIRLSVSAFLIFILLFYVGLNLLLPYLFNSTQVFVAIFLIVNSALAIIQIYVGNVFDFDEPEPKEKKAKASLTELVLKAWQEFIGGLAPAPNYG